MRTFSISTLGCKVNQYESRQIRRFLEQLGLEYTETSEKKTDLIIVNTCCVTQPASAKSRQYIRKAQKLNSEALIVVSGCLPTVQIGELNNLGKNVHLIKHRRTLAAELSRIVRDDSTEIALHNRTLNLIRPENDSQIKQKNYQSYDQPKLPLLTCFKGQTRAFLKVQDGCDGYCSYCIIPKTRPILSSKPLELALKEAQDLVNAGHKEIVLTGIFLGAYGQTSVRRKKWTDRKNEKLPELLDKMARIPNLRRIRLSSLEPADVTPWLLDVFSEHPNIMPHLHLSLQSGSSVILKKMARQYTAEQFIEKLDLIKSRLDRPAITADIIVGFPGETDDDFERTVDLAVHAGFAKMHVFSFSPRKGTPAADMQDTVANSLMKKRSRILHQLDAQLARAFREQFIGQTAAVLIESSGQRTAGRSERYFTVQLEKSQKKCKKNDLLKVKLLKNTEDGLIGRPL